MRDWVRSARNIGRTDGVDGMPTLCMKLATRMPWRTKMEARGGSFSGVTEQAGWTAERQILPSQTNPRLLESDLSSAQISKLKGTGRGGMLTKGDVLVAMGKITNAYGSAEKLNMDVMGASGKRASEVSRSILT